LTKEGSVAIFRGVETDAATLEFEVEDENRSAKCDNGNSKDHRVGSIIGSSAAYSVIPMCEIDFLGGGIKRKITDLTVAIVLDNDSVAVVPNTTESSCTNDPKNGEEKLELKVNGNDEKLTEAESLEHECHAAVEESKENNEISTFQDSKTDDNKVNIIDAEPVKNEGHESTKSTEKDITISDIDPNTNDETIIVSKVDDVKGKTSDETATKVQESVDDSDVFLDAITKEDSIRGFATDHEFLDSKSEEEDGVFVSSAEVEEEVVKDVTSTITEGVLNPVISKPNDVPLETQSNIAANEISNPASSTKAEGIKENDTIGNTIPASPVEDVKVATDVTTKGDDVIPSMNEKVEKNTAVIDTINTTVPSSNLGDGQKKDDTLDISATDSITTTEEVEKEVIAPLTTSAEEEANTNDTLISDKNDKDQEETSMIADDRDDILEEESSISIRSESSTTKVSRVAGLLLPTCTIDIHIEFNPSIRDEKNGLSDLLENASIKKAHAINRLRKAAEVINRVKQSTSETASTAMVTRTEGAVKAGFLNKASKLSAIKKDPSKLVKWYRRVLGPQSLLRVAFPVAKNYLLFVGGLIMMHYQGYQLALPPPV